MTPSPGRLLEVRLNGKPQSALACLTPEQKRELLRSLLEKRAQPQREFALSQHQLGIWFLAQLFPSLPSYNTALAMRACPALDTEALTESLKKLLRRHPSLRTVYHSRDGIPFQEMHDDSAAEVRLVNVGDASEEEIQQLARADYRQPFNLEASPMRVTLFRSSHSDTLLITVHHIAFDAWSANVLFRELRAMYEAELSGSAAELELPCATYRDFVDWQAKMLESPEGLTLWEYWAAKLSGELPILDLPVRRPVTQKLSFEGGTVPLNINGAPYASVKEFIREHRVTVFSAVATAYSTLLHRLSGQREVMLGAAVSGRTQPQWANVIGDFINMLPLRFRFSPELRATDHLITVAAEIRSALAHQDFPFPLMVERLRVPRATGRSPVFQAMINVHVARPRSEISRLFDNQALPFGRSLLRTFPMPQQEGQFDLALELLDTGDALLGGLRYSVDAFDADAATGLASQFCAMLEQIITRPDARISEYEITSQAGDAASELFLI